nr:hypothetical protein [Streptomyces benahoarensis]
MEEKSMVKRIVGSDDRGQTSIEYLGIIAVVVAIVLVLSTTDFGSQIANAIADKISEVVGI